MIWLVGKNPLQFNTLAHSLQVGKMPSRQYENLTEVLNFIEEKPEAILIDMDGMEELSLEFCWIVTQKLSLKNTSIILFSSNKNESMEVSAFQSGASDFILKPFKEKPVFSRIISRLHQPNDKHILRHTINGNEILEINREEYSVRYRNEEITLSRKEFELLYLFAGNPGKVFSREELYKRIWSGLFDPKERTIDVHILRLRKKLDEKLIATLKGVGYRFNTRSAKAS